MDALAKLQEDQKAKLEREEQVRLQQERLAKLAPWAKKETSPVKEHQQGGHQLSLQEIQRLEAERERQDRAAREAAEARLREEQRRAEEEERRSRASKTVNWATAAAAPGAAGNKVKSLAEIQAEEARVERERQERELAARPRTGKEAAAGSAGGSIWGGGVSASRTSTWAGKIAAAAPAPPAQQSRGGAWSGANGSSGQSSAAVVAPAGFWDPVVPEPEPRQQQMKKQTSASNNNNSSGKGKNQKRRDGGGNRDDHHGNARGGGKQKPKNEFEDWCSRALSDLQAQVDIPTFLGFLMDIESPYDVSNFYYLNTSYIQSYYFVVMLQVFQLFTSLILDVSGARLREELCGRGQGAEEVRHRLPGAKVPLEELPQVRGSLRRRPHHPGHGPHARRPRGLQRVPGGGEEGSRQEGADQAVQVQAGH